MELVAAHAVTASGARRRAEGVNAAATKTASGTKAPAVKTATGIIATATVETAAPTTVEATTSASVETAATAATKTRATATVEAAASTTMKTAATATARFGYVGERYDCAGQDPSKRQRDSFAAPSSQHIFLHLSWRRVGMPAALKASRAALRVVNKLRQRD
jgi:hypothetical protein